LIKRAYKGVYKNDFDQNKVLFTIYNLKVAIKLSIKIFLTFLGVSESAMFKQIFFFVVQENKKEQKGS
jgi:hypothetical protein